MMFFPTFLSNARFYFKNIIFDTCLNSFEISRFYILGKLLKHKRY